MAELADAYGSGPYESNFMQVQVLLSAPNHHVRIDTIFDSSFEIIPGSVLEYGTWYFDY